MMKKKFPFCRQMDSMDCGPTCLMMIAKYYGKTFSLQYLRERSYITKQGVSMLGISDAAEELGFHTVGVAVTFQQLITEVPLPCVAHWNHNHFIVIYKVKDGIVYVADPGHGLIKYSFAEFFAGWFPTSTADSTTKLKGLVLLLEPTPRFYEHEGEEENNNIQFLLSYLVKYKKLILQLFVGIIVSTLLQLFFPFLAQSVVDIGINQRNLSFIYLVFAAQITLFVSQTAVNILRSWILLHISTRINVSLISTFLAKLMKLPIAFFDSKMTGDILQRIGDHHRIESFLTSTTLNTLFSFVNLFVFGAILIHYNVSIFFVFFVASTVYALWVLVFLKKRKTLDYKRFNLESSNQSSVIQMINGMQEIKLHNCETQKRWDWELLQAKLYRVSMRGLTLDQFQSTGAGFINELKNMTISFMSARAVIEGDMTLGMMIAVQYIIGQLNVPIGQLISFIQYGQHASISLERLQEIHSRRNESENSSSKMQHLPQTDRLLVRELTFRYEGPHTTPILQNLNFDIPVGKVTAIVGASGSGKTTLLKLLLKFYEPVQGGIFLNDVNLNQIQHAAWRSRCGAVLQDGYIFPETIASNIALAEKQPNKSKIVQAARTANIHEFIEELPLAYQSKIGSEGTGLSQGQKQRLLIARAVYKDPEYIFFDEATNSLDTNNEKVIMENLDQFFKGRTVVVVAHRLSTVRKADQIVVLDKGRIVEVGTHEELIFKNGNYYELIKNQLELSS